MDQTEERIVAECGGYLESGISSLMVLCDTCFVPLFDECLVISFAVTG